jgi:hypothetical protein
MPGVMTSCCLQGTDYPVFFDTLMIAAGELILVEVIILVRFNSPKYN